MASSAGDAGYTLATQLWVSPTLRVPADSETWEC